MRVMHVQIDERPANFFRIEEILEPERIGNHPLEMAAKEPAIFAAVNRFASEGVFGQERQNVTDKDLLARLLSSLHDLIAFDCRQSHRLFDENMLAGV